MTATGIRFSPAELFGRIPLNLLEWVYSEVFPGTSLPTMDTKIVLVSCRCACGTEIVADRGNPAPSVQRHNKTAVHLRWWAREGDDGPEPRNLRDYLRDYRQPSR